jgi:hypothetical protein
MGKGVLAPVAGSSGRTTDMAWVEDPPDPGDTEATCAASSMLELPTKRV